MLSVRRERGAVSLEDADTTEQVVPIHVTPLEMSRSTLWVEGGSPVQYATVVEHQTNRRGVDGAESPVTDLATITRI